MKNNKTITFPVGNFRQHPVHEHLLISDQGEVYSTHKYQILKSYCRSTKPTVQVSTKPRLQVSVADLVADCWLPKPKGQVYLHYKDSDPTNVRASNLDWANTPSPCFRGIRFNNPSQKLLETTLHVKWVSMRQRCNDPNFPSYRHYGGRGISVCSEWDSFQKFYEWSVSNGFQIGLEIDRTNNDGNYEPNNCRFVTRRENQLNTRANRIITAFGESKPLSAWIEDPRCVTSREALSYRLEIGMTPELAMTVPAGKLKTLKEAA